MSNLYDALDQSTQFNKFKVDDLLFVEYTCDPGGPRAEIWAHSNYFTYVVSGKMILKAADRDYEIKAGESYFIKRGAFIIPQFFEEVFCDMIIFIPDSFIRNVLKKYQVDCRTPKSIDLDKSVVPLHLDPSLIQYYQSLFTYFKRSKPPSPVLLKLKFEELIVNILTNTNNPELVCYFRNVSQNQFPSLREVMEKNYLAHLKLSEFAKMSARSLSTFRRDFKKTFHMNPGEWLKKKRLAYSSTLLLTSTFSIDEIAYQSGFSSRTHFVRCFKERFGQSPSLFRQAENKSSNL